MKKMILPRDGRNCAVTFLLFALIWRYLGAVSKTSRTRAECSGEAEGRGYLTDKYGILERERSGSQCVGNADTQHCGEFMVLGSGKKFCEFPNACYVQFAYKGYFSRGNNA